MMNHVQLAMPDPILFPNEVTIPSEMTMHEPCASCGKDLTLGSFVARIAVTTKQHDAVHGLSASYRQDLGLVCA